MAKVKQTSISARLDEEWERLPIERKRAIVGESLEGIIINVTGRGRRTFDPEAIELVWRT